MVVSVPITKTAPTTTTDQAQIIDLSKNTDSSLSTLAALNAETSTGLTLSSFNFLNQLDYGHFYQFADSKTAPTKTYLVAKWIFYTPSFATTNTMAYSTAE